MTDTIISAVLAKNAAVDFLIAGNAYVSNGTLYLTR